MPAPVTLAEFVASLSDLGRPAREDAAVERRIGDLVRELRKIGPPSRPLLEAFVALHPHAVPVLATCVGLSQEQLKTWLSHRFGTSGWTQLARTRPGELIARLDEEMGLVERLAEQLRREWSLADVLLERYLWSRRGARSAIQRGRNVEDEVEAVVRAEGLPYALRTRFAGRNADGPCDLAVPGGGTEARIVVAMKGFNSTGSKLSDAVAEIRTMARVRLPSQYVFAVVDGIGWKNRASDLRRIHELWDTGEIDGLYSLASLDRFAADVRSAAIRLGISGGAV
jgi:hypothetical protein